MRAPTSPTLTLPITAPRLRAPSEITLPTVARRADDPRQMRFLEDADAIVARSEARRSPRDGCLTGR